MLLVVARDGGEGGWGTAVRCVGSQAHLHHNPANYRVVVCLHLSRVPFLFAVFALRLATFFVLLSWAGIGNDRHGCAHEALEAGPILLLENANATQVNAGPVRDA